MSIQTFIPTIWSARLLEHLNNAQVALSFVNRNWEGEIKDKGSTVRINQIGDVTINDYDRNNDLSAPEELNTAAQDLIIDQADAFNFQIDDLDAAQANAPLMDAAMQRAGYKMADKQDKYLFKLMADSTPITNTIGTAADPIEVTDYENAYGLLVQIRTIMAKNNVPTQMRRLALPPEFVGLILKDKDRFTQTSQVDNMVINGMIARGLGFDIFEVNNLPVTGEVYSLIGGHEISTTYANQITKTEAYRMEKRFADGMKGLSAYGAKTIIPSALVKAYVKFA